MEKFISLINPKLKISAKDKQELVSFIFFALSIDKSTVEPTNDLSFFKNSIIYLNKKINALSTNNTVEPLIKNLIISLNEKINEKKGLYLGIDFKMLNVSGKPLNFEYDILSYDKFEKREIAKIEDLLDELKNIDEHKLPGTTSHFYFRGHRDINYRVIPSIARTENLLLNEDKYYQEILAKCPNDFRECKTHIDYLTKMQHYGVPTRLLDITTNPLIALYFACEIADDKVGELIMFESKKPINYSRSDKVSILSSLPLLNKSDKDKILELSSESEENKCGYIRCFNSKEKKAVQRLLHEIKTEKPAFRDIINPEDISSIIFVKPQQMNNRIIRQDGAFILCGLHKDKNYISNPFTNIRYKCDGKVKIFFIKSENKEGIKKQLAAIGINQSTVYPDIENVSKYIMSFLG